MHLLQLHNFQPYSDHKNIQEKPFLILKKKYSNLLLQEVKITKQTSNLLVFNLLISMIFNFD